MKFTTFVQICFLCFLASCENPSSLGESKNTSDHKEIAIIRTGTPITYELEDTDCGEHNALDDIRDENNSIKVWIGVRDAIQLVSVEVPPISGHGLQSEFFADALRDYKLSYDIECKPKSEKDANCSESKKTIHDQGQRLHFCKKGGGYKRESLENVALASMVGVAKTYSLHKKQFPDVQLNTVTLLVHPLIEDVKFTDNSALEDSVSEERHSIKTDNAYWFQVDNKNYITSLPPSEEFLIKNKKNNPHFWEYPSTMGHEYGHHIVRHYAPNFSAFSSRKKETKLFLACVALEEGISDLIAYFTHKSEYADWGWFNIFDVFFNREPSKTNFSDGSQKKLDELFLFHYFRQTQNLPLNKHQPNPTNRHDVGAVIAHAAYKLFTEENQKLAVTDYEKAFRRTILWISRLEQEYEEYSQKYHRIYLEHSLQIAFELVKKDAHYYRQCVSLHEIFPVFPELSQNCIEALP